MAEVEFFGGPEDGLRMVMPYPLPHRYYFPVLRSDWFQALRSAVPDTTTLSTEVEYTRATDGRYVCTNEG